MSAAQAQVQGAQGADVGKLAELIDRLATSIYSYTAPRRLNTVVETYRPLRMVVDAKVAREGARLTLTVTVYVHDLDDGVLYRAGHVKVETKRAELEGALAEVARRVTEAHASVNDVKGAKVELCSRYYLSDLVELFINTKATMIELSKMVRGNVTLWADMCAGGKDVIVHAHTIHPEIVGFNTNMIDYYVVSNNM